MTVADAERVVELNNKLTKLRELAERVSRAGVPASCDLKVAHNQYGLPKENPSLRFVHLIDEWRELVAREAASQIASIEAELVGLGVVVPLA